MEVDVRLTDAEVDAIASRVATALSKHGESAREPWLDVPSAADHVALTEDAIRGLVKRRQIPFHRTKNGRLRFSVAELDHWVRTGSCATTQ
jgi:Helix-turn-helix domain